MVQRKFNFNFLMKALSLMILNHLSVNPTKWSNTLKQFVGILPTNCLSVFDHFVKLALKGLKKYIHAPNIKI